MERLTNEAIKVDASVDGMIGSFVDLANMKPKLLDVILNGPTLISVSKNVLRSIIRQLYSALAAYEDTGLTPEQCENAKAIIESVFSDDTSKAERIRELLKADKEGRVVVLPCNKALTNADRMRTATNQQLAKQLYDTQKELCRMLYKKLGFEDELNFSEDYSDILAWLNATSIRRKNNESNDFSADEWADGCGNYRNKK